MPLRHITAPLWNECFRQSAQHIFCKNKATFFQPKWSAIIRVWWWLIPQRWSPLIWRTLIMPLYYVPSFIHSLIYSLMQPPPPPPPPGGQILHSKPILWELEHTGHSLRQLKIYNNNVILDNTRWLTPKFFERGEKWKCKSRHSVSHHWTGSLDQDLPLVVNLTSLIISSSRDK
jgi:hypothetical protein